MPNTALSFASSESVRFQTRLDGWDTDWTDAPNQRSATYPQLPAGDYEFHVEACNEAGVWNERGATLSFKVEPFIWQTWWFRVGTGAIVFTSRVWGIRTYERRKVQLRLEFLERQHAIKRERTRIARDIHDELGTGLTQIGLLADLGANKPANLAEVQNSFDKIGLRARTAISALDEIVWAANPRNDNLPRLADYLCHLADDCFDATSIRCRKEVPTGLPPLLLGTELRHNPAMAVKETLANVLKHSHANTVWLRLAWNAPELRITVEDDGVGFDAQEADPSGNGIGNQASRMKDIGGTVEVQAKPGTGTRIVFSVRVATSS